MQRRKVDRVTRRIGHGGQNRAGSRRCNRLARQHGRSQQASGIGQMHKAASGDHRTMRGRSGSSASTSICRRAARGRIAAIGQARGSGGCGRDQRPGLGNGRTPSAARRNAAEQLRRIVVVGGEHRHRPLAIMSLALVQPVWLPPRTTLGAPNTMKSPALARLARGFLVDRKFRDARRPARGMPAACPACRRHATAFGRSRATRACASRAIDAGTSCARATHARPGAVEFGLVEAGALHHTGALLRLGEVADMSSPCGR